VGTMAIRIFVPRDSTALALGADEVAAAIAEEAARRQLDIDIVRNGTRGLLWLEPLVEVETAAGRTGFGEVTVEDVGALFDAGFHLGQSSHRASLGLVEEIPYLKEQQRLTFARTGITDPLSLADYEAHGGYEGLRRALTMEANAVVDTVIESGLRAAGLRTGLFTSPHLAEPTERIRIDGEPVDAGRFAAAFGVLVVAFVAADIAFANSTGAPIGSTERNPATVPSSTGAVRNAYGAGWPR